MANSNLDDLDLNGLEFEKKKLEIEKLEFDIKNPQHFPPKWAVYLQPLMPTFFTLASISLTYIILNKTKFFENANNLYTYQNLKLKDAQVQLLSDSIRLQKKVDLMHDSVTAYSDTIKNYKLAVNQIRGSMTGCEIENGNLKIENKKLILDNIQKQGSINDKAKANLDVTQGNDVLIKEKNKLSEKITSIRSRLHDYAIQFSVYENEIKKDPTAGASQIGWIKRELGWLVTSTDKEEPQ
jgi:hypothetical protein